MSGCNDSDSIESYPKMHCCPVNGERYASVKRKTMLHHVVAPWDMKFKEQGYYFCTDPDCDVVYFGQDNFIIGKSQIRTTIWQKSRNENADICYCFGVSQKKAHYNPAIKQFVTEQVKVSQCACEIRNPSGRCCLKDFPKH